MRTCTTALAAPLLIALIAGEPPAAGADVHVWQRWERSFTSNASYANPYADVTLLLHITDPAGVTSTIHGFWDGGDRWTVRYAFPAPGTWTYVTECSNPDDAGLHSRSGSVEVEPYAGGNPLYRHGFPRPAPGARHFEHRDGEPFFFLADTAWEPWIYLSYGDWTEYVDDRASRGFSVILTACGFDGWWSRWPDGGCAGSATAGIPPWFGPVGNAEQLNPAHFAVIDAFAEYANARGIAVGLFGVMNAGDRAVVDLDGVRRFARAVAARLQGNAVIISPPVDDGWNLQATMVDVGRHLRASDDTHAAQLLTYHMATDAYGCGDLSQPGYYGCDLHGEPWVDFTGYQSGHNRSQGTQMILWSVRRAREMPLHFQTRTPPKPAVNVEPLYEMPPAWFPSHSDLDDNEYRCRQIGWTTYLSGGAGHAYGVRGIWDFGRFQLPTCSEPAVRWQDALGSATSRQAELTGYFFRSLPFHLLGPRHDLIADQTSDQRKKKVLAMAADGSVLAAYVPRGHDRITIDTREMAADGGSEWYDPRSGARTPGPLWTRDGPPVPFYLPDPAEDWVVLLTADGLGSADTGEPESRAPAPAPFPGTALEPVTPNPFSGPATIAFTLAEREWIRLRVYDASGRLVRALASGDFEGGLRHALTWDGTDERGRRVGAGTYVVDLEAGGRGVARKALHLR